MAVEIVWKVLSLKVRNDYLNFQNMVVRVEWNCIAHYRDTDIYGFGAIQGETYLDVPENNFTPFEQLTEAQIISWVHQIIGSKAKEYEITATRHAIGGISSEANLVAAPLPWAQSN